MKQEGVVNLTAPFCFKIRAEKSLRAAEVEDEDFGYRSEGAAGT